MKDCLENSDLRSGKGLLYKKYRHLRLEAFLIQILQKIKEMENLLLATLFMLGIICLLGEVKSIILHLVLMLKQSMETHTACEMM